MLELQGIPMPKTPFRLEKDFTTHFLAGLKAKGYWVKKWSDASMDLKPYDCDIATEIASYHTEIKLIKKDSFTLSQLRPNQIKALEHLTKLGRNAIVVIYSIEKNSYLIFEYKELVRIFE